MTAATPATSVVRAPTIVIGVGLGGFIDGIVGLLDDAYASDRTGMQQRHA